MRESKDKPNPPHFAIRYADTVIPKPVEWIWPGRIPRAKLSLVIGDPGVGKSLILLDMAARISCGKSWPDGVDCEPGRVIYMSTEDDPEDTLVPRLISLGANLSQIILASHLTTNDNDIVPFRLDIHLPQLTQLIEAHNPACVFLDPLSSYIGPRVNSWVDAEVRSILGPLSMLSSEHATAIIGLMHMNKDIQKKALYRAGGSIGFVSAARAVFIAVADGNRRYFGPIKMNLAKFPPTLGYRIEGDPPRLVWQGGENVNLDELISKADEEKTQSATEFLRDLLSSGRMSVAEIYKAADQSGVAPTTLRRAKKGLNILSVREGFGQGATWFWELPLITTP